LNLRGEGLGRVRVNGTDHEFADARVWCRTVEEDGLCVVDGYVVVGDLREVRCVRDEVKNQASSCATMNLPSWKRESMLTYICSRVHPLRLCPEALASMVFVGIAVWYTCTAELRLDD